MIDLLTTKQEEERLRSLKEYLILDTLPEKDFDNIAFLAAQICNTPISLINFIDDERQWFKAAVGMSDSQHPREHSFCLYTAENPEEVMVVPDARKDDRFADNPYVTGQSPVIFYAGSPIVNDEGYFLGTLCVISDKPKQLTEQQRVALKTLSNMVISLLEARKKKFEAEEKNNLYRQTLKLLEDTSDLAKVGGWSFEVSTQKTLWTETIKMIHEVPMNYNPEIENGILFYKPGKSRNTIRNVVSNALTYGKGFDVEVEIVTAKGKTKWVRAIGKPEMEDGKTVRLSGILQDIHEEKIKDIKLAQSELQFRQTFSHAATGMALVSLTGRWLKVNKSLCSMIGYSEKELLQITFQDITHPDDLQDDLNRANDLARGLITSYQIEKRYFHKNGSIVWVMLSVSLVKDMEERPIHFVSQIVDITLRKQFEEELNEERKLLTMVIDNLPVNIFIKDKDFKKVLVNQNEVNYLGAANKAEVLGKTDYDFYPDETALISLEEDKEVLFHGKTFLHKETYNVKSDGSTHWFLTSKIPLKNDNGEVTGLLGICHDITERKNSERITQELMDVTTEQNNRLINFAHIVSHNLKSYAINFSLLLNLINEETDEEEKTKMFTMLNQASDNLVKTIDHLNEIVIINTSANKKKVPVNLHQNMERIKSTLNAELIAKSVKVYNNIDKSLSVEVLPAYLDSVLLNFITNGIKYRRQSDERSYVDLSTCVQDKYVIVTIKDNGLGIDMARNKDKLFGMYKTFHDNKDARGIGLFITKNQIIAMGGKIEVESELGKGTTFKIYLLRSDN